MNNTYLQATRHPWPSFWFMLPLLLVYEIGVLYHAGPDAESLRTGTDAWMRYTLHSLEVKGTFIPPLLVLGVFGAWMWVRRDDRPTDLLGTWTGIGFESVGFALLLLAIGRLQFSAGDAAMLNVDSNPDPRVGLAISFIGAGIYEEFFFRLLLFPIVLFLFSKTNLGAPAEVVLAMIATAALFSFAHHLGPYGEPYDQRVFLFRAMAGLFFTVLFWARGIGVAMGAHAVYDVLVGVAMR
jgi:membrane protease YdiL (CAAX protease family)